MHTAKRRSPTAVEQQLIAGRAKPDIASWGCLVIFFGIVPAYLLGKLGGWLGGLVSEDSSTYGRWVGWVLSAVLFVSAIVRFLPYERRVRGGQGEMNTKELSKKSMLSSHGRLKSG